MLYDPYLKWKEALHFSFYVFIFTASVHEARNLYLLHFANVFEYYISPSVSIVVMLQLLWNFYSWIQRNEIILEIWTGLAKNTAVLFEAELEQLIVVDRVIDVEIRGKIEFVVLSGRDSFLFRAFCIFLSILYLSNTDIVCNIWLVESLWLDQFVLPKLLLCPVGHKL